MSSSMSEGLPVLSPPGFVDIDVARRACAGAPALRLDTGDVVELGGFHDRQSIFSLHRLAFAVGLDERDFRHS